MRVNKAGGFTLIESVVVIVLLGTIAAKALPQFVNVTDAAHHANAAAMAGAVRSAATLVEATYVVKGRAGVQNSVNGFGGNNVDVNAFGYPVDTTSTNPTNNATINANKCLRVWNGVLDNAPTITTGTSTAFDYRAQAVTVTGQRACRFTYRRATSPVRRFDYFVNTGNFTIANP